MERYSQSNDAAGRLTGVSIPGEGTITFNADSRGLPSGVTMPGGTSKQFGYDPMMSLVTNVAVDSAQNAVMSRIYSRNKVQNIIGQKTEHGTYAYQYDQLDQLTNSIHPVFTNESFVYDPMGNRLSSSGGMRVVASTYGANVLNQYTNLTTQQPGNSTTAVLGYDLNGNQLVHYRSNADGSWTTNYLAWDISDRLTEIRDASSNLVARYTYDPFGRRLSKTVFSGATSNVTYFLYADEGLVAEFDEAGNEIRAYGYAPGSLWMNDPLYLRTTKNGGTTNQELFFFLTDHLGAPQKLVDKNGAVVWAMVSESFGETVVWEGSTITNNLRFSSQYWDEESGLHYNTMRYYDAGVGRYVSRDPVGELAGEHLMWFCANAPMLYRDPDGQRFWPGYATLDLGVSGKLLDLWLMPGGNQAEGFWKMWYMAFAGRQHVNLGGSALDAVKQEASAHIRDLLQPRLKGLKCGVSSSIDLALPIDETYRFGGRALEGGMRFWQWGVWRNPFWTLHDAHLKCVTRTTGYKTCDGVCCRYLAITRSACSVDDKFDFVPDHPRSQWFYNTAAGFYSIPAYRILGADQPEVFGYWDDIWSQYGDCGEK